MSDSFSRLDELQSALDSPAVRLLNHKWAPAVLTLLKSAFGEDTSISAARLHSLVDAQLGQWRDEGIEVPVQDGRALCAAWTQEQWLTRLPTDDGGEEYERTRHAHTAERLLDELSRDRALLSQSRLTTIMDTASRWAAQAQPGADSRAQHLRERIRAMEAELAIIEASAAPEDGNAADDEQMMHGYADLADLLAQLPADFRRVEESIGSIHRSMLAAFRQDERPRGEVLDEYLAASNRLMDQTEEGRAFSSALAVLGDESALRRFRDDLRSIMDHPFAQALPAAQRRAFLNASQLLRRGMYDVQARQHKSSRALADQLHRADAGGDREVARVLRRLQAQLAQWMLAARPRDRVTLSGVPARATLGHLRTRLFDPTPPPAVEHLEDVSQQAPAPPELDDVRRHGGPLLEPVRSQVHVALESGVAQTLGGAFETLPDTLRRPVELFGLMELATATLAAHSDDAEPLPRERVRTVRPDGSIRHLSIPRLEMTAEQASPHGASAGTQQEEEA